MTTRPLISLFFIFCFLSCSIAEKPSLIFYKSKLERKKNAPFSDAVLVENTLYLAGQVGINPETKILAGDDIQIQTEQTLQNIKDVLEYHGSDLEHVVKCTVILADINDFKAFNAIFRKYFPKNKPARTTFAADLLVGAKIEIDVIAVKADGFKDARVN